MPRTLVIGCYRQIGFYALFLSHSLSLFLLSIHVTSVEYLYPLPFLLSTKNDDSVLVLCLLFRVWRHLRDINCLLLLKVDAADGSVSERSSVCAKVKDSLERDRLLLPTHPCLRFSSKVKKTYQIAYWLCIVPGMLHWCTLLLNGNTILSNCIYWKTPAQKFFCFVFLVCLSSLFPSDLCVIF